MKYVCMEDIENLAAQGKKELVVDENTVLMELARDMARQLGIEIIVGSHSAPPKAAPSSPAKAAPPVPAAPSSRDAAPKVAAKPKGCQHGPSAVIARPERSNNQNKSGGVMDQLVELVKQSAGKSAGNQ